MGKGLPEKINKALNKEGVRFNPLVYKVKFAGETGRIDSVVIPLDLSVSAEARELLALLENKNQGLTSFKGTGKITFRENTIGNQR